MKTSLTLLSVGLFVVIQGCGASESSPQDPRELEADEIDQIVAALGADPMGAVDGVASDPTLSDDDGDRGRRDGRGPRSGDRRGRGVGLGDLILWYGDLTALQACRDEREACLASGATTCNDAARECVVGVLEGAFDAMCADRTADCADAGAMDRSCGRIIARCEAGLPFGGDGGGWSRGHGDKDGGGGWGDRDHDGRGGDGRGRGGRNCDGGEDDEDPPTDEEPGPDAAVPAP